MLANTKTRLCAIIGYPVEHSMSPAMHNAAFKELNLNYVYLAFKVEDVAGAIQGMRTFNIRGFSVTIPHKLEVMKHLDEVDSIAKQIGAVNTVVNDNNCLKGYNTDWVGFIQSLKSKTNIKDKKIVILGAGGAARSIAFGLQQKSGQLTILNQAIEIEMAKKLASEIGCPWGDLSQTESIIDADIVINATSVGMRPLENKSIIDTKYLQSGQIVYDIVYNPLETRFLKEAKEKGCHVISGYEMLLFQGAAQFELWTHKKAPIDLMKNILLNYLKK